MSVGVGRGADGLRLGATDAVLRATLNPNGAGTHGHAESETRREALRSSDIVRL